ncbi:WD repeat-containing protein SL1-17-like [Anticarsia gemmatalis]|uniref:WD repeat-containing protein SL1-17-like n=1 Tax=Anticarsia gemmatalis TaxID=129554 RepID=UPI003F76FF40
MPANVVYSILFKKENAHDDPIYCCAWVKSNVSGDSANAAKDLIVTGGLDGVVKVWKMQNDRLEQIHALEGHLMGVVSVAINPAASMIVSASLDSNMILWDLNSGKKITEVAIGESDVWQLVFSPDGEHVATGGHLGKVQVFNVSHGSIDKTLDTRGKFILSIDWSPDGKYIATGSEDGTVCILDVQQGKVLHTIEAHSQPIRSVSFSPCSNRLATASNYGFIKVYGVVSAGLQGSLGHKTWMSSVCFAPDGVRIAAGAADGSVRVVNSQDLTLLNTFQEHNDTVWGVHFDSSSKKLISVSKDKCINLYECPQKNK